MFISDRSKEIIEYLINANQPLSVSDLSRELQVTERTIYRQMAEVTETIESFDLKLDNTSGKGMQIFGSLYNIKRLNASFEDVKREHNYTGKERIDIIILTLLQTDDFLKTQSLAIDLNTSSQTVRNDFTLLKEKVKSHNVEFITKKSEGVKLDGNEIPKRHLFVNTLLQNISPDNFFDWLKSDKYKANPFIDLLQTFGYSDTLKILYQQIDLLIYKKHLTISDHEFQEFLLLIAVFIHRHSRIDKHTNTLKLHFNIPDTNHQLQEDIALLLEQHFDISIYDSEQNYFCWIINLYTGRTRYQTDNQTAILRRLDNVSQLIGEVEKKFHFPFSEDENLAESLMLHINMSIERIQSGITVSNPMLEEIYQSNPRLYEIVKENFVHIFKTCSIPEDEIGYVVIYFIASMDYLSKQSISVLVVCSTGIGSSKMLRSRLEREFSEIDVKKIVSLHKLRDENLDAYDFIISTVPLDMDTDKYLCVSPLLNEREIDETRKKINMLNQKGDHYV